MPTPEEIQRALELVRATRKELGGFDPGREYRPPDQNWREAYAREHGGKRPGEVPGETELEAIANLLWSQDFARLYGRGPTQAEWEAHWQDYIKGRDKTWESYLARASDLQAGVGRTATRPVTGGNVPPPPSSTPSTTRDVDGFKKAADAFETVWSSAVRSLNTLPFFDIPVPSSMTERMDQAGDVQLLEQDLRRRLRGRNRTSVPPPPQNVLDSGREFIRREGHVADVVQQTPADEGYARFRAMETDANQMSYPKSAEELKAEWESSEKSLLRNLIEQVTGGIYDAARLYKKRYDEIRQLPDSEDQSLVMRAVDLVGDALVAPLGADTEKLRAEDYINALGLFGNIVQAIGDPTASLLRAGAEEAYFALGGKTTEERLAEIEREREAAFEKARRIRSQDETSIRDYVQSFGGVTPETETLSDRERQLISMSPEEFLVQEGANRILSRIPPAVRNRPEAQRRAREIARGRLLGRSQKFRDTYDYTTLLQYGTGNILPSILDDPRRLDEYFKALAVSGSRLEAQQEVESILSELPVELLTDPLDLLGYAKGGAKLARSIRATDVAEEVAQDIAEKAVKDIAETTARDIVTSEGVDVATVSPLPRERTGLLGSMARRQASEPPRVVSSIDVQSRIATTLGDSSDVVRAITETPEAVVRYAPAWRLEDMLVAFRKADGDTDTSIVDVVRRAFAEDHIADPKEAELFVRGNKGVMQKYEDTYRDVLASIIFSQEGFNARPENVQRWLQKEFEAAMKSKIPEGNPRTWVQDMSAAFTRTIRHPDRFTPEKVQEYVQTLSRIRRDIEAMSGGTYTVEYEWITRSGDTSPVPVVKGVRFKIVPTEAADLTRKEARRIADEAIREAEQAVKSTSEDVSRKASGAPSEAPPTTPSAEVVEATQVERRVGDLDHSSAVRTSQKSKEEDILRHLEVAEAVHGGRVPPKVREQIGEIARQSGVFLDPFSSRKLTDEEVDLQTKLIEALYNPNVDKTRIAKGFKGTKSHLERVKYLVEQVLPIDVVKRVLDPKVNPEGVLPKLFYPKGVNLPDWAIPAIDRFGVPFRDGPVAKFIKEYMTEERKALYGGSPWPGHVVRLERPVAGVEEGSLGIIAKLRKYKYRGRPTLRALVIFPDAEGRFVQKSMPIENVRFVGELQRETWDDITSRVTKEAEQVVEESTPTVTVETARVSEEVATTTVGDDAEVVESYTEVVEKVVERNEALAIDPDAVEELKVEAARLDLSRQGKIPDDAFDDAFLRPPPKTIETTPFRMDRFAGREAVVVNVDLGTDEPLSLMYFDNVEKLWRTRLQVLVEKGGVDAVRASIFERFIDTFSETATDAVRFGDVDLDFVSRLSVLVQNDVELAEIVLDDSYLPLIRALSDTSNINIQRALELVKSEEIPADVFREYLAFLMRHRDGIAPVEPASTLAFLRDIRHAEDVPSVLSHIDVPEQYDGLAARVYALGRVAEEATTPVNIGTEHVYVLIGADGVPIGVVPSNVRDTLIEQARMLEWEEGIDLVRRLDESAQTVLDETLTEIEQAVVETKEILSVSDVRAVVTTLSEPPSVEVSERLKKLAERFEELAKYDRYERGIGWLDSEGNVYTYKVGDKVVKSKRYEAAEIVAELRTAISETLTEDVRSRIQKKLTNYLPVRRGENGQWLFARTKPPSSTHAGEIIEPVVSGKVFAEQIIDPSIDVVLNNVGLTPMTGNILRVAIYDNFIQAYGKVVGESDELIRTLQALRKPYAEMIEEDFATLLKNVEEAFKRGQDVDALTGKAVEGGFRMTYEGARRQLAEYMRTLTRYYADILNIEAIDYRRATAMVDKLTGYKSSSTAFGGLGFLYNPLAGKIIPSWRWIGIGSPPLRAIWRAYTKTALIQGLVGAIGIGAAFSTPLGDVLIERDNRGELKGFIPDIIKMMAESVGAQMQTESDSPWSWASTLWNTTMAFFEDVGVWSNISVGLLLHTIEAESGKDGWITQMIRRDDLSDAERQALLYALGVSYSGEESVKAAYEEILSIGRSPTWAELQVIYDKHRDPLRDFVGTVIFDPLKFVNLGTLFRTGTGAVALKTFIRTGEWPEYVGMGFREFQQWRNAKRLIDAGETRGLWSLLSERIQGAFYSDAIKVTRAQRRADMLVESAIGTFPFALDNYQEAVNIIFQELADIGGDVQPIIQRMNPDRMAAAIGRAIAQADPDDLKAANYVRDLVRRTARAMSRDAAYEALGVARRSTNWRSLRGIIQLQKTVLGRLLLNSLNFGFHITNTLGDIGTTILLGMRQVLAPEADGYLSLVNIGRMRDFFRERFGFVPSVVDEAFDVLGEERSHTLFGRTPILKNVPVLNRIPQPETLSSVRVYTAGVAHWLPRFWHAGVDAIVEKVVRDVGIKQPDLAANIAMAIKAAWKEEEIVGNIQRVLIQYGYSADEAERLAYEIGGQFAPVLWRARAAALAGADELRKQTIHHYWKKSYADEIVEAFMPYQFWYSRGIFRWTTAILEDPTILSNYYKFERLMLDGLNGKLDDPEYMRRSPSLPTSVNPYLGDAVAAMMDRLVIALYPDITEENVTTEAVYVNIVDKLVPVRNLYAFFGSEYSPDNEKYDTNIVTNLITAGGRFGPALSPFAPIMAAGLGRVLGVDVSNIKYLMDPTIPFAQDRLIQGLSIRASDLIAELTGDEEIVGPYGWTLTPAYRRILSNISAALSGQDPKTFWGYTMPDYYYKETARRIAEAVNRGEISPGQAYQLIRDQDVSNPLYRQFLREASAYYANRGDISAITGILARYDTHTDVRDLRNQLYDMAIVRDENGNPVVDENGQIVWNFEHPNVVAFMEQYPAASVFAVASKEWEERRVRAATTLIWDYASDYTRRQFSFAWKLKAANVKPDVDSIKADPTQLELWMQYLQGYLPSTLLQRFMDGTASPADIIAVSRELDRFRLTFTNPELERARMEAEALIDLRVQNTYPRYALLNSLYWWLRSDQNNPRAAKIFLENNPELVEAWELRRQLLDEVGIFPVTPTERAYLNLVDPPSESQKDFARAIGFDPDRIDEATSRELSAFITKRKREAMQAAGIESDVELEYIQAQVAKADDVRDPDERQRLLENLLTPTELAKWEAYKEALYIGEGDYRGYRILLAIDLGMPPEIARRAKPSTIESFIEAKYAYARKKAGVSKLQIDALQDLAHERGWDVLTEEEQNILKTYYEALGKSRPVTKERIKLAIDLGMDQKQARTVTADELEAFIDMRFEQIAQEKAAAQANFNNAARSVGLSPEQMSVIIDTKNSKGWNDLTIGEAIALQRFYLAYYQNHPDEDKRTYTSAFLRAAEDVGATVEEITVLLARKKVFGWNSLSRSEKDLLRRFQNLWEAYD